MVDEGEGEFDPRFISFIVFKYSFELTRLPF